MKHLRTYPVFEAELGWKEWCSVPGVGGFVAKLDTGNGTKASSLGVDHWSLEGDRVRWCCGDQERVDPIQDWSQARVGHSVDRRPIILLDLVIGPHRLEGVPIALADRAGKEAQILINRELLSRLGVSVSPDQEFTLGAGPR
jgi:hypothetical protein